MAWLMKGDRVLASLEMAGSTGARAKGLLGRDGIDGALYLAGTRGVHTFGMRFAIDVAYLDGSGRVLEVVRLSPNRFSWFRMRAKSAVEAEAGAFEKWGVGPGDVLEVKQ